jgi:hypothetical protein
LETRADPSRVGLALHSAAASADGADRATARKMLEIEEVPTMKPTTEFAILQELASGYGAGHVSLWGAAAAALQALMDRVQCSRVSLWAFDLDGGRRALQCFASKRNGEALKTDSTILFEDQYRDYFAALVETGVFVANDARIEPSLIAMRGVFLERHRIGALMDVAVTINGRAYGIVCCEQIPGPRQWRPEDIASARSAVSRAALLLAADPSIDLETIHSVAIEPFQERRLRVMPFLGYERRAQCASAHRSQVRSRAE